MTRSIPLEFLCRVRDYVWENGSITNQECRRLLGVNYDEAIKIFNAMCILGTLRRTGTTSGTKYVMGDRPEASYGSP